MRKSTSKQQQQKESMFPVMKFDYNFNVIYSNDHARPLMNHWNCDTKSPIPMNVLERHPEIYIALKNNLIPDINIKLDNQVIRCSIVPFPEAGYIGIYGYMVEYADKVHEKITISSLN